MKHPPRLLSLAVAALCAPAAMLPTLAQASSHREAPFITTVPKVDGTDMYMFRSYESGRQDFVTLIANYLPLQDGYGGPNYFALDPNALYEIHIDNDGDAREDITFQFRFKNTLKNLALNVGGQSVPIPLVQAGGLSGVNPAALNVRETYSIKVVNGDRRGKRRDVSNASGGGTEFDKPTDFIGTKTFGSIAAYEAYVGQHLYSVNIPGCSTPGRVFVGQRKDPFVVNLGRTFDLINLNPLATSGGRDDLAFKNVTTIAMEVATSCLASGRDPVIGAWTTASLPPGPAAAHAGRAGPPAWRLARGRAVVAGLAAGHALGQRSGHRPEGQGPLQFQQAQGRRAVRHLCHQPDPAGADRDAVLLGRREGADEVPAQ